MAEEGRPTGITYEAAIEAAKHGGSVDFEGRKVRVVSISARTGMDRPYSARLDLDLARIIHERSGGIRFARLKTDE